MDEFYRRYEWMNNVSGTEKGVFYSCKCNFYYDINADPKMTTTIHESTN